MCERRDRDDVSPVVDRAGEKDERVTAELLPWTWARSVKERLQA